MKKSELKQMIREEIRTLEKIPKRKYFHKDKLFGDPRNLTPEDLIRPNNSLTFYSKNVPKLPEGLEVKNLEFFNCILEGGLPNNLTVRRRLTLINTNINKIPMNLTVRGEFMAIDTNITSIPECAVFKGSVYLDGTKLTSLPRNLKISTGKFLAIRQTPLEEKYTLEEILEMIPLININQIISNLPGGDPYDRVQQKYRDHEERYKKI